MDRAPSTDFAWAIIGPGRIAHRFAEALAALPATHLRCVHGRDVERAAAFAQRWQREAAAPVRVDTDLDTLLADPRVDAVYVATPHASHAACVRRCLEAGKPVLCEKPLAPTLAQARELVALSRERRVFLMEALWTRLLPLYTGVRRWLDEGAIGTVQALQSSFCFAVPYAPESRLFDPALAGGTLLDIGIYNLAMTRWVLEASPGTCPEPTAMHCAGVLVASGVDQRVAALLEFPGGVSSQFVCAFDGHADNTLRIHGSVGTITVAAPFWGATTAVLARPGQPDQTLHAAHRINGFEEEIEELMHCVRAGRIESPRLPHAETLGLVAWIDTLRARLGVSYPFE
ncbi:MAG: Gfo/Idh/MocA family oxidoreductase [Rubrivivax sp.]|nr:Gfo/Idh/MocA family oxidoreductase [Rubrivivax sp.]